MDLSDTTMKRLIEWLSQSTWNSKSNRDLKAFYDFIHAYVADYGYQIDRPRELIEYIAEYGRVGKDTFLYKVIERRISEMTIILKYLEYESSGGKSLEVSYSKTAYM
ncbi:hypothetical protein [Pleionea sp. CnH1-48]|uniref:hypothetical protein n=1 Tax=Pleionea sp. CnH1-48 TaxID=2954494 RepID=UPI002097A60A|nr:hypothetical protein [Pleionea sp. CnH1-48]MCO7223678.1 hypothetical protein [Pleionea sp. CnH1-48]